MSGRNHIYWPHAHGANTSPIRFRQAIGDLRRYIRDWPWYNLTREGRRFGQELARACARRGAV